MYAVGFAFKRGLGLMCTPEKGLGFKVIRAGGGWFLGKLERDVDSGSETFCCNCTYIVISYGKIMAWFLLNGQ